MRQLLLPTTGLVLLTGCYDYVRVITTLTLDPAGQQHQVRLEFVDVQPDEDECDKGPVACAESLHQMRDWLAGSLEEDVGLVDVYAQIELHGDDAHLIYTGGVPADSDLLGGAEVDVELWGKPGNEKRRYVVSAESELGLLAEPKRAVRRTVQQVVEDEGLVETLRYELHKRTATLTWTYETEEDEAKAGFHLLAEVPGTREHIDTSRVAAPPPEE